MASVGHCFYCFECLSASFASRDPPPLDKVLDLYEQYEQSKSTKTQEGLKPGLLDNAEDTEVDSGPEDGEDEGEDEEMEEDKAPAERDNDSLNDEDDEDEEEDRSAPVNPSSRAQNRSISRLQASTPSSASSNTSTPSILSANSSNSALTNASSVSSTSTHRPSYASRLSVTASYPLFVTWQTMSRVSGHKTLRGCIGTFDPVPLVSGLQTYALTSAFDDTRFSPIPSSLLPSLACSITLLADFESCRDATDWTVGKHGLRISFTYRGRRHGATYLPDVALEQEWTKEETLESLMKKAGWDGGSGHGAGVARRLLRGRGAEEAAGKPWEEVTNFKAVRYTGLKASATYGKWREWKSWVDGSGL